MPVTLVDELKFMTSKNHYMDVSETIRGLLRQKLLDQKSPVQSKVNLIKNQLGKISDHEQILALKKTLKLLEDINEL
jgi:hypothetical protein